MDEKLAVVGGSVNVASGHDKRAKDRQDSHVARTFQSEMSHVERAMSMSRDVLVTGATGYMGTRLVEELIRRQHRVRAFVREESQGRVPPGATVVIGDALDAASIYSALREGDCLVHLVGTPHPSPSKAEEFKRIDLTSAESAISAATRRGIAHFVYISVAHPAPVMREYISVRVSVERLLEQSGLTCTVLRPWYVVGPGHRWPLALTPLYAAASLVPTLREGARRLGLVTMRQMIDAIVRAVESPPFSGTRRIVEVPDIRAT